VALAAQATPPLTVDLIARNPDAYLGDKVQITGILAATALGKTFIYASVGDANAANSHAGIDTISEDKTVRQALRTTKPTCAEITGVFNIVGKDGQFGAFGFEGFGYIMVESVRPCRNGQSG